MEIHKVFEKSEFWDSFWPSFWSGSASGIITGVFTGFVVGYVMLRYQRGIEERASKENYRRELSIKISDLRQALGESDVLNIMAAKLSMPNSAKAAMAILAGLPLTLWQEALPEKANILNAAINLQKAYASFGLVASETDQRIQQRVRSYNHARGTFLHGDQTLNHLCVGMLLGVSIENLLPWLPSIGDETLDYYSKIWNELSQDDSFAKSASLLQEKRAILKLSANDLLKEISV